MLSNHGTWNEKALLSSRVGPVGGRDVMVFGLGCCIWWFGAGLVWRCWLCEVR